MFLKCLAAVGIAAILALSSSPQRVHPPVPAAVTISGVDSHDGMIYQDGGLYYWVGSRYGRPSVDPCVFRWHDASAPWCGFGVWSSPDLATWTFHGNLFDPAGTSGTWHFESWQQICRYYGCFNPRMIKRLDGVWVLWFNAPHDLTVWGANQFWAMGCNSPKGPCGTPAGAPYGSTIKPWLPVCAAGGDFSILTEGADAWLYCGVENGQHTVSVEKLAPWWADGTGIGATNLAGLSYVEGTGIYRESVGRYVLTHGDNCPFCSGTDTSYAIAPTPLGPFQVPAGAPARRRISPHSCGGQPRTVVVLNGQPYEQVDHWYDGPQQGHAATSLLPLVPSGAPWLPVVDGSVLVGPIEPIRCH